MTADRVELEGRLAYEAKLDAADAQYQRNMRKGQEDFLQVRIEELEARNSDFSRANQRHCANKLTGETKIRDLQNSVNFYQGRLFDYRKHADAEIHKLEKEKDTLTKKNSALDAELLAKNAIIVELQGKHGTMTKKISNRNSRIKSKDVLIAGLEKEKSGLEEESKIFHDLTTSWREDDEKKIEGLDEQVRDLQEELKKAKETIAASKASLSPAPLPTPASTAQTGRSPSPLSQSAGQKWVGSYPSPSMSSSQGSSVRGGASPHMPDSEVTPPPAPAQSSSLKMGRHDVVHAHVEK
jgi:hypothetical protein